MSFGNVLALKKSRLLLDVSLWSGNLINLRNQSIPPLSGLISSTSMWPMLIMCRAFCSSRLDQSDQSYTSVPLHTHLMMTDPLEHLEEFVEAGSSIISLHVDQGESRLRQASDYLKGQGVQMGLVLRVEDEVSSILPFLADIGLVLVMGTRIGIKGASLETSTPNKIQSLTKLLAEHGVADTYFSADGGIREHTVPLLRQAGIDMITPGSLVSSPDTADSRLATLAVGQCHGSSIGWSPRLGKSFLPVN